MWLPMPRCSVPFAKVVLPGYRGPLITVTRNPRSDSSAIRKRWRWITPRHCPRTAGLRCVKRLLRLRQKLTGEATSDLTNGPTGREQSSFHQTQSASASLLALRARRQAARDSGRCLAPLWFQPPRTSVSYGGAKRSVTGRLRTSTSRGPRRLSAEKGSTSSHASPSLAPAGSAAPGTRGHQGATSARASAPAPRWARSSSRVRPRHNLMHNEPPAHAPSRLRPGAAIEPARPHGPRSDELAAVGVGWPARGHRQQQWGIVRRRPPCRPWRTRPARDTGRARTAGSRRAGRR